MPPPKLPVIVVTSNDIPGREIDHAIGLVRGIVVRTPNALQGVAGSILSIFGGNIGVYTGVCEKARQEAYDLMIAHAVDMGADAIVAARYDATEFMQGATEVLAYGTAVKLK